MLPRRYVDHAVENPAGRDALRLVSDLPLAGSQLPLGGGDALR